MMFILRTIFWLSVAMAIVPARQDDGDLLKEIGRTGQEAVAGYCTANAAECLDGISRIIRIGQNGIAAAGHGAAEMPVAKASATAEHSMAAPPLVSAPAVPLPMARPQG